MTVNKSASKKSPLAPVILIILLLFALFIVRTCQKSEVGNAEKTETTKKENAGSVRGLNRSPSVVNYSKHARCRMECRHIDESEIKDILENGKINYNKSELEGDDCKKKYAVEGTTRDQQRVRIIFAPCQTEVTVVTVIDIGKEWECDCN